MKTINTTLKSKRQIFLQKELTENPNVWIYLCKKWNSKTSEITANLNLLFEKFHQELHEEADGSIAYYCINIQNISND